MNCLHEKGSHHRIQLAVHPPPDSLSDHLGTWWGRGLSVQVCELFSPARVHQLHILAKLVLDVAYCRGQLSTKDDRSGKGRVNAGRKNTQNSTQWGLTGQDLTCGGATGLADCSWWGQEQLLSWNNQATPEFLRFKECMIFVFLQGVNDHWSLTEREYVYFAEEVFLQENTMKKLLKFMIAMVTLLDDDGDKYKTPIYSGRFSMKSATLSPCLKPTLRKITITRIVRRIL